MGLSCCSLHDFRATPMLGLLTGVWKGMRTLLPSLHWGTTRDGVEDNLWLILVQPLTLKNVLIMETGEERRAGFSHVSPRSLYVCVCVCLSLSVCVCVCVCVIVYQEIAAVCTLNLPRNMIIINLLILRTEDQSMMAATGCVHHDVASSFRLCFRARE